MITTKDLQIKEPVITTVSVPPPYRDENSDHNTSVEKVLPPRCSLYNKFSVVHKLDYTRGIYECTFGL